MPAMFSKVLVASTARRLTRITPKARADQNSRSTATAPGAKNQFSQIEALIDSQNRTELSKYDKGELVRYLQQIAPFEEDFDVEKDELVDVLLLSGNAGGPEDERALNDFDLSFLDEGLPPDDDVFKFTDDNGQFDKGPIPVNEEDDQESWFMYPSQAPPAPGAMNALVRERNLDPSYAEDSAADAMGWHSEDTGERDSGAYLDAQSSDSEADSWMEDDLDMERQLHAEGLGSEEPAETSRGASRSFRKPQLQREGLEATLPPLSAGYATAREKLLGGGGGVVRAPLSDMPPLDVGTIQGKQAMLQQSGQGPLGPGDGAGEGSELEVQVEMEQDDWGEASSADDEEILYDEDYKEDREIQDVLDDLTMNNAHGRDVLDVINDEVIEDDSDDDTESDFEDDEGGASRSPGAGGVSSLMGSRPRLPWQQQQGGTGEVGFTGDMFRGDEEDEGGLQQRQRARVGYLRGDIEGPSTWFDSLQRESRIDSLPNDVLDDNWTEEQTAQFMEDLGLTTDEEIARDKAQLQDLQAPMANFADVAIPEPPADLGLDPTVLGLDRTWGGAEAAAAAARAASSSGGQEAEVGGFTGGWTWAGVGALQSWDESEMAQEIDEIKRELMGGQTGGLSGWEAAVESSLMTDSEGEEGTVSAGESGDRGSRRETAARLHPRAVSTVRQSASVAAAAPLQESPAPEKDTNIDAPGITGSGMNFFKQKEEPANTSEAASTAAPSTLQTSDSNDTDAVEKQESESAMRGGRGRRKSGVSAAPDQSTVDSDKEEVAAAEAVVAPKKRGRKPSARKAKKTAEAIATPSGASPVEAASSATDAAKVAKYVTEVQADTQEVASVDDAVVRQADASPAASAAAEVATPARKSKRGRPKKQPPATVEAASAAAQDTADPATATNAVATAAAETPQPPVTDDATSSKSTPVDTEASAAAPRPEADESPNTPAAVASMASTPGAKSPASDDKVADPKAQELPLPESVDEKKAPKSHASADDTSEIRQLSAEPPESEPSVSEPSRASSGRKKRPIRRLSDAQNATPSPAPEASRTADAKELVAGSAGTRSQRQQKALELQTSVEVRKQQLLWLEGEVERMRVHTVAAEQRQKLLEEMQDLRAQLEGWSGAPAVQAQLGELRDPALFPPPDPTAQQRAEVTVEILQDEVDGLRQQLSARADAAAALQRDINAEYGDSPGTLLPNPTGADDPTSSGPAIPGESGNSGSRGGGGGGVEPLQRAGFDSEDVAANTTPQSLGSEGGSVTPPEDSSTGRDSVSDRAASKEPQSSDSVREALSRTFQRSPGKDEGSRAGDTSSGKHDAQDSLQSSGGGVASSSSDVSGVGDGSASVGGGVGSGAAEPGRQSTGNDSSAGSQQFSGSASAGDASREESSGERKKEDSKQTPMPKVGQLVNWLVNTVLPRPWK